MSSIAWLGAVALDFVFAVTSLSLTSGSVGVEVETPTPAPTDDSLCTLRWIERSQTDAFRCLVCHDGTVTSGVGYQLPGIREFGGGHPVDVNYESIRRRPGSRLRPINQLPPEIVLVENRVACTTCHDGYSPRPARVAMSLANSMLCTSCHEM